MVLSLHHFMLFFSTEFHGRFPEKPMGALVSDWDLGGRSGPNFSKTMGRAILSATPLTFQAISQEVSTKNSSSGVE